MKPLSLPNGGTCSLLEYTPFQGCVDGFDFKFVYVLGTVWADRPPPAANNLPPPQFWGNILSETMTGGYCISSGLKQHIRAFGGNQVAQS